MEFSELNLHPDLQKGLTEAGYITCMPVQEQVLNRAFGGQDLYVQSQTGTGKTAAFLIVIFQRLLSEEMLHGRKAIIMVPTRELAVQVEEEAKLIGKYLSFKTGSFFGGVGYTQQNALLRDNVQIMVGTPGRVLDLNQGGQMNLMEIAFLVLDEADRMFDMGFYPDLRKLIRAVPPVDKRQTMLFSATLNAWVKNLAWEYTKNPFEIAIEPEMVTVEEVDQVLYHVSSSDKMKLLLGVLKKENPDSALIFCNTKRYAEIVAKRLRLNGLECEFIMGDLPQPKRLKIIEDIKEGKLHFLVATDVAARGLDIEDLGLVVNYDLPNESENYVHRIGRTARAGKSGKAVTLASEQDVYELPGIERYIGRKIPSETATEALFAEDKSEGKRIQTDFYEEHGDGGHSRGRRRDSGGRRDSGRRDGGRRRNNERQDNESRSAGEKRRGGEGRAGPEKAQGQRGRQGEKPGRGRREAPFQKDRDAPKNKRDLPGAGAEVKLSELSLEERMAYYKQKYDNGGAENRRRPPKRKDDGQNKKQARGGNSGKRKENSGGANTPPSAAPQPAAAAAPVPAASSPKKGLLSRLAGIFKK